MKAILFVAAMAVSWGQFIEFKTESERKMAEDGTAWVASSLRTMKTIKVGMTRGQLLTVFVADGGFSTRYVFKDCPYFKVDVEFERHGDVFGDKIVKISQPYLYGVHTN